MSVLLLRNAQVRKASSLQSFNEYRQNESQNPQLSSVTSEGLLLEYETLELRLHPPNVDIDNDAYDDVTVITIDSANRPGTLIEVVQCLTELGLSIKRARISSDGGWFVDEFFVTETPKGKVHDARKLALIKKLLSVSSEAQQGGSSLSVFELSGRDYSGLLVSVLQLLVSSDCEVTSAAVWTFHNRCALVLGVTDKGVPITDAAKSAQLQKTLREMLGGEAAVVKVETVRGDIHHERRLHHLLLLEELRSWDEQQQQLGEQLRLQQQAEGAAAGHAAAGEADAAAAAAAAGVLPPDSPGATSLSRRGSWSSVASAAPSSRGLPAPQAPLPGLPGTGPGTASGSEAPSPYPASASPAPVFDRVSSGPKATNPGASPIAPAPTASLSTDVMCDSSVPHSPSHRNALLPAEVKIQHSPILNYWLVTIASKDRNKLFFDTVCTFADLNYDVFHSTIDSEGDAASQLFYVRPRYGEAIWDAERAHKLKYMLESAVQRRFPKGLKIHVQATDQRALLDLFQQLSSAGFWVTRAEVRCHQDITVYNFSLTDQLGQLPSQNMLQRTCEMAGGVLVEDLDMLGHAGTHGSGGGAFAAPSARSEAFPAHRAQSATGTAMPQKLLGSCRFAFSFLDKRYGTGGGGSGGPSAAAGAAHKSGNA